MDEEIKGTHQANFDNPFAGLPTAFVLSSESDYDATHYAFEDMSGTKFLVPKGAVRYVCPRPADAPLQPVHGAIIRFEGMEFWTRLGDGLWYLIDSKLSGDDYETIEGVYWDDLWAKYGNNHYVIMTPVEPNHFVFAIEREGPAYTLTIPDTSSGEPVPWLLAMVDDEGALKVNDLKTSVGVSWDYETFVSIAKFFWRTQMVEHQKRWEAHQAAKKANGGPTIETTTDFLSARLSQMLGHDVQVIPVDMPADDETPDKDDKE